MQLAGIEVRMRVSPEQMAYLAELEMTGDSTEVMEVTLRFAASRGEVATVGKMLVPGQDPPREFWEALDYGDVKEPKCSLYEQSCQAIGHSECLYKEDCTRPPTQADLDEWRTRFQASMNKPMTVLPSGHVHCYLPESGCQV